MLVIRQDCSMNRRHGGRSIEVVKKIGLVLRFLFCILVVVSFSFFSVSLGK